MKGTEDPWAFWRLALIDLDAAIATLGDLTRMDEADFYQIIRWGYYRRRNIHRKWRPIAIWYEPPPADRDPLEGWVCKVGRHFYTEIYDIGRTFWACHKNPVSYEAYQYAMEHGVWADDKPKAAPLERIDVTEAPPLF